MLASLLLEPNLFRWICLWVWFKTLILDVKIPHLFFAVIQASSCAKIHTPASVVLAGSPVSVSCSIEDDCPLTKGKDFRVAWKMNNHFVPSNLSYQESNRTYGVIIPTLSDADAFIACAVCKEENCQIVKGVQVKAGCEDILYDYNLVLIMLLTTKLLTTVIELNQGSYLIHYVNENKALRGRCWCWLFN